MNRHHLENNIIAKPLTLLLVAVLLFGALPISLFAMDAGGQPGAGDAGVSSAPDLAADQPSAPDQQATTAADQPGEEAGEEGPSPAGSTAGDPTDAPATSQSTDPVGWPDTAGEPNQPADPAGEPAPTVDHEGGTDPSGEPSLAGEQAADISGMLWLDGDGTAPNDLNGLFDEGEPPLGGYPVYLYDAMSLVEPLAMATTGNDGAYAFSGLASGDYILGLRPHVLGGREYLLPTEMTSQNRFAIDWVSDPLEAYTATLAFDGNAIEGVDGGLRVPARPGIRSVGSLFGPYSVTDVASNNADTTISSSGQVWEVSGTSTQRITVNSGVTTVLVLNGAIRSNNLSPIRLLGTARATIYLVSGTINTLYALGSSGSAGVEQAGIYVPTNATLTVQGPGSLIAYGGLNSAGIGGVSHPSNTSLSGPAAGTVIIEGGHVYAQGGLYGAGIGGGIHSPGGVVIILGGYVEAHGGNKDTSVGSGAGIGGGGGTINDLAPGGSTYILGGEVVARAYNSAAAIGGGLNSDGNRVEIHGGVVDAQTQVAGPGIGAGAGRSCGTIIITGGVIYAKSSNQAAAIGNGLGVSGGTIAISGGIIHAVSASNNASGVGGGGGGSATITITGGSIYSINPSNKVRINYNPSNGAAYGNALVYMIAVKLVDQNGVIQPDSEISVFVGGSNPYTYRALTNAGGYAYIWLPEGSSDYLLYNPQTGTYVDDLLVVARPADPSEYDPATNTQSIQLRDDCPQWSLTETPSGVKTYGEALLDLVIVHNNIGSNPAKAIVGVRWYRESVQAPTQSRTSFEIGFAAASNANKGVGGLGQALHPTGPYGTNAQHLQMGLLVNGRYWVEIHYKGANTGRDVRHVAYVDVRNVYTPVNVSVRGFIPGSSVGGLIVDVHPYILQTQKVDSAGNLLAGPVGIPLDADGSLMENPTYGYDRVRYYRPSNLPPYWWDMLPLGYPFMTATTPASALYSDMELGKMTLGSNTTYYTNPNVLEVTANSTPADLFYKIEYQPQHMSLVTAYFVDPAGQPVSIDGSSTAQFMVPLDSDGSYQCTNFKANGGVFMPSTAADPVLARGYYVRPSNNNVGYPVSDITQGADQNTFHALTDFTQFNPTLVYGTQQNANQAVLANNYKLFIVFSEPPPPATDFTFYKVDMGDVPLAGVAFELYCCPTIDDPSHSHDWLAGPGSCWVNLGSEVSGADGEVGFEGLASGDYMLVEAQTLPGYQLPQGQWLIEVDMQLATSITAHGVDGPGGASLPPAFKQNGTTTLGASGLLLPNHRAWDIPASGSHGMARLAAAGVATIGAAGVWASATYDNRGKARRRRAAKPRRRRAAKPRRRHVAHSNPQQA
jgi:hypothetical protein